MVVQKREMNEVFNENMMNYSAYVLLNRAIPSLEDGQKPVTRRILWAMHEMKATKFAKSADVVGRVMQYHPHGSSYDALVHMVQGDNHMTPYLVGKGNFSSHTTRDLGYAADRYTEVKLSPFAMESALDFEGNIVDFKKNYNGRLDIAEVLPVKVPTILTHSQSGIGVGYSSSIPSFNLREVAQAIRTYFEKGEKTALYPDFATRGLLVNNTEEVHKMNGQGIGKVALRGRATIEKNTIYIHEIPYSTTREAIIEKVVDLYKKGKMKEVTEIKDLVGLDGMRIKVQARRGTDMELLLEKLYRMTPLESNYSANMNVLHEGLPKVYGVWDILDRWLTWRISVIKRSVASNIEKLANKIHILKGYEQALLEIEKTIDIIRNSTKTNMIKRLMDEFKVDEMQAIEIGRMQLRNLNPTYMKERIDKRKEYELELSKLQVFIEDANAVNEHMVSEIEDIAEKYGSDRQTEIIELSKEVINLDINKLDEVKDFDVCVKVTRDGYVYKTLTDQDVLLKPNDEIVSIFNVKNSWSLYAFDSNRNLHLIKLDSIDITRKGSIGNYIPTMIKRFEGEVVSTFMPAITKELIIIYKNSNVAKIDVASYLSSRSIMKNAYSEKEEIFSISPIDKDKELVISFNKGKDKLLKTKDLRVTKSKKGMGIRVKKDVEIVKVKFKTFD